MDIRAAATMTAGRSSIPGSSVAEDPKEEVQEGAKEVVEPRLQWIANSWWFDSLIWLGSFW